MGSPQRWPARFLTKTRLHDTYLEMTERPQVRKRSLAADTAAAGRATGEIDIARCATIAYSSEDPLTRLKICSMDSPVWEGRPGSARVPTRPNISWWNLTSRRRSRGWSAKSRRPCGSAPRRCATVSSEPVSENPRFLSKTESAGVQKPSQIRSLLRFNDC